MIQWRVKYAQCFYSPLYALKLAQCLSMGAQALLVDYREAVNSVWVTKRESISNFTQGTEIQTKTSFKSIRKEMMVAFSERKLFENNTYGCNRDLSYQCEKKWKINGCHIFIFSHGYKHSLRGLTQPPIKHMWRGNQNV